MADILGVRFPNYRLRTLMIAVAVVATLLWSGKQVQRLQYARERRLAIAASHFVQEREAERLREQFLKGIERRDEEARQSAELAGRTPDDAREAELYHDVAASKARLASMFRLRVEELAAVAKRHARIGEEFERSARLPWLAVTPEPPDPE